MDRSAYNLPGQSPVDVMSARFSSLINSLFEPMVAEQPPQMAPQMAPQPPLAGESSPVSRGAAPPTVAAGSGAGSPTNQEAAMTPRLPARQVSRSNDAQPSGGQSPVRVQTANPASAAAEQSPTNRPRAAGQPPQAASTGSSQMRSVSPAPVKQAGRPAQNGTRGYNADPDDLLDQHVAYYFRHHPDVYAKHQIVRKRPGVYELNGREIGVEWQYGLLPGEQGQLMALDGPLRQPFADYMAHSETNAEYVTQGLGSNALHAVPHQARMTFDDQHKAYTRLEAMKVAKEQAKTREQAAEYAQMGMAPPTDLRSQYEKTLNRKLSAQGKNRWTPQPQGAPNPMAAAPPAAGGGVPPPILWPGYPGAGAPPGSPTAMQGSPTAMQGGLFGTPNLMGGMGAGQQMTRMQSSPGPPPGRPMMQGGAMFSPWGR